MIAAQLEIDFLTNLSRLSTDMGQAVRTVGGSMSQIEGAIKSAKKVLEGFGVIAGADLFKDMITGAIEAQAHLDDLSKSTGIATEQLAGLQLAAKVSGTDLDTAASSINKLSANVGKNADAFRALGITTKDPMQAIEQLGDVLSNIQDPTLRAAVASQALGKGWQAMAPFLSEGGARIRELVDEGTRLSGVTAESAKAANELNKHWLELVGTGGLLNTVVNAMVPTLDALVKKANEFKNAGFGDELLSITQLAVRFLTPIGALGQAFGVYNAQVTKAAQASKEYSIWAGAGDSVSRKEASDAAAAGRAFLESAAAKQDAAKVEAFYQQALREAKSASALADAQAANGASKLTDAERQLLTIEQNPLWAKIGKDKQAEVAAILQSVSAKQELVQITEAQLQAQEKLNAIDADTMVQVEELMNRGKDRLDQANATVEQLKEEIATLGLSDGAREQMLLNLQREKELRGVLNPEIREGIIAANDEAKALAAQKVAMQAQLSVWTELGDRAGTFFADLVMHGKSAFADLRDMVKQLLADMIKLFVQRWVLNLAAGGTVGGAAGQALTTISSGGQGSSLLASGVSLGGNYLAGAAGFTGGIGTFGEFAGAASGAIPSAAIGADAVAAGVGVDSAAAAAGSAMAGVYSALAAVPVWGWIAMAVVAIGAWIAGNHKGGPKFGGSAFGSADASGNFVSSGAVPGTDNGRLFTPDQIDPQLQQLVAATALTTAGTITALGGRSGGFNFALGADNDPHGTAQSRVSALLTDALGHIVYSNLDQNMDDKAVPQALQLETERMMVAAIKASSDTLDPAIAAVFKDLDPLTASFEDLDAAVKKALEIKAVIDALGKLGAKGLDITALQAWQHAGETITQTFQRVAGQFAQFDDAFMTDAQKLDTAHIQVVSAFKAMGVAIPDSAQSFYDLVHGLDLSTQAGRDTFDALMAVAPAFLQVENAATSMIGTFNSLMGQIRGSGFTKSVLQGQLQAALTQFGSTHSFASGWDPSFLLQQLLTITPQDFANYAQNDASGASLINQILGIYSQLQGLDSSGSGPVQTFTSGVSGAADAAKQLADQLAAAKASLGDYLQSLLVDKTLSPLSPADQQEVARQKFYGDITKAQGGDLAASQAIQGDLSTYLGIARQNLGSSSAYVNIFTQAFNAAAGVAGVADYNTRMLSIGQKQADLLSDVKALLIDIRDRGDSNAGAIVDATGSSTVAVTGAVKSATVERR